MRKITLLLFVLTSIGISTIYSQAFKKDTLSYTETLLKEHKITIENTRKIQKQGNKSSQFNYYEFLLRWNDSLSVWDTTRRKTVYSNIISSTEIEYTTITESKAGNMYFKTDSSYYLENSSVNFESIAEQNRPESIDKELYRWDNQSNTWDIFYSEKANVDAQNNITNHKVKQLYTTFFPNFSSKYVTTDSSVYHYNNNLLQYLLKFEYSNSSGLTLLDTLYVLSHSSGKPVLCSTSTQRYTPWQFMHSLREVYSYSSGKVTFYLSEEYSQPSNQYYTQFTSNRTYNSQQKLIFDTITDAGRGTNESLRYYYNSNQNLDSSVHLVDFGNFVIVDLLVYSYNAGTLDNVIYKYKSGSLNSPYTNNIKYYYDYNSSTSISKNETESEIQIFPNPVLNNLSILGDTPLKNVKIYTSNGILVYSIENVMKKNMELDLSKYPKGLYFVVLGNTIHKIVKQ